jgi:hypothetical protein
MLNLYLFTIVVSQFIKGNHKRDVTRSSFHPTFDRDTILIPFEQQMGGIEEWVHSVLGKIEHYYDKELVEIVRLSFTVTMTRGRKRGVALEATWTHSKPGPISVCFGYDRIIW